MREEAEVFPDDHGFKVGEYKVLVVNRDEDEDEFTHQPLGICLNLKPVSPIIDLTHFKTPLIATCSPDAPQYFKYEM